jgi:hypothetical protein
LVENERDSTVGLARSNRRNVSSALVYALFLRDVILISYMYPAKTCLLIGKSRGKAIRLQALTGPEGSRRLRLPDFKTIGT